MSSSRVRLACSDSRMTNRQGVEWCGAGAVMAAATARRTAAGSTGASVKSRTVRLAASTSPEPSRNMSSAGGRISARPPGPSSSVTRSARPRTIATGMPLVLALTRSAAAAISSATAATVTSSRLPNVSGWPRWSSTGSTPAAPIAASVCPARQGRPSVSVTMTPTLRAEPVAQGLAQPAGRAVGVLRQQHHRPRRGVGVVHAGGGEHQAVPGLHDPGVAAARHHPDRLRVDRLLPAGPDHPALRLAHDLGGDHHDVAVGQVRRRVRDQPGQVGAGLDLGEPGHAGDGDAGGGRARAGAHAVSSWARSSAARAIAAVAARSVMYSGTARTAMPASSGASTAVLSRSSTSQPSSRAAP